MGHRRFQIFEPRVGAAPWYRPIQPYDPPNSVAHKHGPSSQILLHTNQLAGLGEVRLPLASTASVWGALRSSVSLDVPSALRVVQQTRNMVSSSAFQGIPVLTTSSKVGVGAAPVVGFTQRARYRATGNRWAVRRRPRSGPCFRSCLGSDEGARLDLPQSPATEKGFPTEPDTNRITLVKSIAQSGTIGVIGSALGSLIGAGGGIVLTPLLTSFSGLSQLEAHATSLCVIAVTAAVGAAKYNAAGSVVIPAAMFLASAALITAPLGARAASRLDNKNLKMYFGICLVVVSCLIPVTPRLLTVVPGLLLSAETQRLIMIAVGTVTGFLSGLLGIGGGTIMVPVLVLLTGLPQKVAQGTALLAMTLPACFGAFTHLRLRNVALPLLPGLFLGAVAGGNIGSSLALHLGDPVLRCVCAFIFFCIGVRYVSQGISRSAS